MPLSSDPNDPNIISEGSLPRRRRSDKALAPDILVSRFPGPAVLADAAGGIVGVSAKGVRLAEILEQEDAAELALGIVSCSSDLIPRVVRVDFVRNSERLNFELTLIPVEHHEEILVLVLGRDATVDRKLTEALVASRRLFKDIEAVSSDFGWETDADGRFTYVSMRGALGFAAQELHGDSARRLAGAPIEPGDLWPFESPIPIDSAQLWLRRKDGARAFCEISSRPVQDDAGAIIAVRGVVRDVTERKLAEEARAKAEAEAIAANEAKSRFLAIMSHELRTPINSVIGNLELLKTTGLNNDQAELIQSTEVAAESLLRIIGDVLDFSKIEAGKIEVERLRYQPDRLVFDVVSLLNPSAIGKGVTIEGLVFPSTPTSALFDPYRVRQILMNLVGNALKFTEIGGVFVTMAGDREPDGRPNLLVRVEDTGVGFDSGQFDLFQPFTQEDESTTRRFGGSGLGLSICRGLVERMGGRIGAQSTRGTGASFWFTIPLEDPIYRTEHYQHLRGQRLALAVQNPADFIGLITGLSTFGLATRLVDPQQALAQGLIPDGHGECFVILTDDRDLGRRDFGAAARILFVENDDFADRRLANRLGFTHVLPNDCDVEQALSVLSAFVREELPPPAFTAVIPDSDINELRALLSGRKVLVLEDNPMSRAVVQRQFNALGINLDLAENGRQGLEKVEANDYAVILSDCAMPEIDGYLFTQILRRRELGKGAHVPVIAMTANAGDDDAKKCLAAGMDDFMTKPVRLSSLAKMLGKWAGAGRNLTAELGDFKAPGPAVDLSLLSEILGVNTDADFDEALDLFVEYFPTFMAEAETALARGDFDAMGDSAHTAKGAARNAGALPLGEAMGRAETCAKLMDAAGYRAALAEAGLAWAAVQAFVADRLGTREAAN